MRLLETGFEDNIMYLVCEYIDGEELLIHVEDGPIQEKTAKDIIYKVLIGTSHIHSKNIIHRDLKLENIFINIKQKDTNERIIDEIKIVDLGLSKQLFNSNGTFGSVGTPSYMPPESFGNSFYSKYDYKFDAFSIGVILYTMLANEFPFNGDELRELINNIKYSNPDYDRLKNNNISENCIDLIKLLLLKDKDERISIDAALNHEYFKCHI